MKILGLLAMLLFAVPQIDSIVAPKVEHHKTETQIQNDYIERTCPDGYEGHFVDQAIGFEGFANGSAFLYSGMASPPVFAICFKKSFMDEVRKNADLSTTRPRIIAE